MKKFLRFGWNFLQLLIIIYVVFVSTFVLFRNQFGYTQLGNYTFLNISKNDEKHIKNSKKGDLLVIKLDDIKEEDLIYYYGISDDSYIVKCSKVKSINKTGKSWVFTFYDNSSISSSRVLGEKVHNFKLLGDVLNVVESKYGFLLLVLLPIFIVFLYQIYEFIIYITEEEKTT